MKQVLCAADALVGFPASMVSALLCAATLGGPAWAAPAGSTPAENTGLEEIIVTAEKRESTVQATPISMTALSAGDLLQENITSVQDLVGTVPGLSLRTAGPGQTEYEMRGLGSSGGSTATVGFYIDETPLSASAVALDRRRPLRSQSHGGSARAAGNSVRRRLHGRYHQARHQSAQARDLRGCGFGGHISNHGGQHQRRRQFDAEFSHRRPGSVALRDDG